MNLKQQLITLAAVFVFVCAAAAVINFALKYAPYPYESRSMTHVQN
ncbi:MAG: hypothetical protein LBI01_01430 [Elusimicrobium sp.]|jgi:hypothetical protein|nr:hypothetical protein [Elusimicrobium sp.]